MTRTVINLDTGTEYIFTAKTAYAAQETRRRAVKGKAKGGMQSRTEGGEKELNREQTGVQG